MQQLYRTTLPDIKQAILKLTITTTKKEKVIKIDTHTLWFV